MTDYRIFSGNATGQTNRGGFTDDLGVQFKITTNGTTPAILQGFYFWAPSSGDFDHTKYSWRLYSTTNGTTGTLISGSTTNVAVNFTASSWNYQALASPITLTNGTTYVAVLHSTSTNASHYTGTNNYWSSGAGASGIVSGPITAPGTSTALGGKQNAYNEPSATASFPTSTLNTNYWLDVLVTYSPGVNASAGVAMTTASALPAPMAHPAPGKAAATGAAQAPAITDAASPPAGRAQATAASLPPVVATGVPAGCAAVSASALAPTITDSDSAPIGSAAAMATAYAATVSFTATATADIAAASVVGSNADVFAESNVSAGAASVTVVALGSGSSNLNVFPGSADVFAFANDATPPGTARTGIAIVRTDVYGPALNVYVDAVVSTAGVYGADVQVGVQPDAGQVEVEVDVSDPDAQSVATIYADFVSVEIDASGIGVASSSNPTAAKASPTVVAYNPIAQIGAGFSGTITVTAEALAPFAHTSGGSSAERRVLVVRLTAERTYKIPHESREKKVKRT